jgi:hypothetical protein
MSSKHDSQRRLALAFVLGACVVASGAGYAQGISAGIMVCQTPAFWCTVPSPDYPTGTPCWCNLDAMGYQRMNGYAINPRQVVQEAERKRGGGEDGGPDVVDLGDEADDCLNGLGNCDGSFKSLVKRKTRQSK